ncbi:MAG: taurine dioxygenase [Rhodospirillaceae bacterium]|nr:taurine dioxygenase [Rhodospirillaceae bacterium]MBT4489732.1 taurine dioxygenase [Rhodospirillaceae bacterium]MBT5194140.1 taurine dioxygenase [Rhodospirillaceae bacterium]MBT5897854.1 taurine dioxygenase [Rhodospirillaceae bacterium]MBT6426589.1 taurine dioxygenase [Rhodospirillaceae bacterium]
MQINAVTGGIGAEISGVDIAEELSGETIAAIRQALLDHLVVFFRDQDITPEQQIAFVKHFGEPDIYPFVKGLDEHPEITPILKLPEETINFGGIWHSDTVYLKNPPMGTVLYAKELPPMGGDTLFANQYAAYDNLSAPLREFLDGLTAVNSAAKGSAATTRSDRVADAGTGEEEVLEAEHPAVRTHPETGRKALFVNFGHTVRFKGMTKAESTPILEYLFQHQIKPEYSCRFIWSPGALAFWDNRCAQHYPVNDYHGYKRLLHRITLKGDKPF